MLRVDLRHAVAGAAVKTLKTTVLAEGFSVVDLHTSARLTIARIEEVELLIPGFVVWSHASV
jgi:hypothetical protein